MAVALTSANKACHEAGARDFSPLQNTQTNSRAYPVSSSMGGGFFLGGKKAGT